MFSSPFQNYALLVRLKRGGLLLALLCFSSVAYSSFEVSGDLLKWHRVVLTFDGPESSEDAAVNPFLDYRLIVTFRHGGRSVVVPGYYAADGDAGETGAVSGGKWRVLFSPDAVGDWSFEASFRSGSQIAIDADALAGKAVSFDGDTGNFTVTASDKQYPDFRQRGLLQYNGTRYLAFAETGEIYIKGGPDSPENFLAYEGFDQTYSKNPEKAFLKSWMSHVGDWQEGDPTWRGGKGKGIIGALNYLETQGMNVVYFLTQNIIGDGEDVWPYTDYDERYRFDCSKLDQWEIVFEHMTRKGIALHVVTQERENDQLHDEGELGIQRRLYYRELIARFAHHPAIIWNLGEENTNTSQQIMDFCDYFEATDPYGHPVALHTVPYAWDELYKPLLGYANFDVLSVQTRQDLKVIHEQTTSWIARSSHAGRTWPVFIDEPGIAWQGVEPDSVQPNNQAVVRKYALWGNLMGGGSGVEYYFGYSFPHSDLNCEDWRTREQVWKFTRSALEVVKGMPLAEMHSRDMLTDSQNDHCLAKVGDVYAVYSREWERGFIDLREHGGEFEVSWFNPRTGEGPFTGEKWKELYGNRRVESLSSLKGGSWADLGMPPFDFHEDWLVILKAVSKRR